MRVWTVGHSTHSIDAFVALLVAHDIAQVADIPHFHIDALAPVAAPPECLRAGDTVCHIGSTGRAAEHRLTPFATVGSSGQITYPTASQAPTPVARQQEAVK